MLYKKYHRNFVRQFKVGVEFIHRSLQTINVVTNKPFISGKMVCIGGGDAEIYLISIDGKFARIVITRHVV